MKFELEDMFEREAIIKVIGVGGGGGNAVDHMINTGISGVDFIGANTDAQALRRLSVDTLIQLGSELTQGLGAGTNPDIGKQAAQEDRSRIEEEIDGADMVFLTAGMGGGTGTGAIPVIAEAAKDKGILTVAVVTKPFKFEGAKKMKAAEEGIVELEKYVDSLIIIPNQKLLPVLGNNVSLIDAFNAANDVLREAVQGITELIVNPGLINVDFADVKTIMSEMGVAIMGTGIAKGDNRAREAAEKAVACPLLDDVNLFGAKGILVNITATAELGIAEFNEVGEIVHEFASEDAVIKMGTAIDTELGDEIKVTVVATGMGGAPHRQTVSSISSRESVAKKAVDYGVFEKPTAVRQREGSEARYGAQAKKAENMDYLDIPAFLRRQAD
ncbi:MAG: cell division protein FtsZ [Methylococcales bacterium]|jgi:cell division protein FtsZ|nr:cell division protein FtsZ [Methylococcales bacterium]